MSPTTLKQITHRSDMPFAVKEIIDITDSLPKKDGGWENALLRRKDGSMQSGLRKYEDITQISVHHSGTEGGSSIGHARYHVNKKGWPSIAYHCHIIGDQPFQCNDLLSLTFHTANNNFRTISVCVEGNFDNRELTFIERRALYAVLLTYKAIFPLAQVILGHKEFDLPSPTACPGKYLDMNIVRSHINYWEKEIAFRSSTLGEIVVATETYARMTDVWNSYNRKDNPDKATDAKILNEFKRVLEDNGRWGEKVV